MIEAQRTISRLQASLVRIGNLPLEFNTRARAIAQEEIGDSIPGAFSSPLSKDQIYKILHRETTHKKATKEIGKMTTTTTPTATAQNTPPPYTHPEIEMIKVDSSKIDSVGHDGDNILRVKFKNGGATSYDYVGVKPEDFFGLVNSESIGKAHASLVMDLGVKGIKITVPEV
jgi:hypothetical protein